MPELVYGLISQAVPFARFEFAERMMAHVNGADAGIRLLHQMQAEGTLGGPRTGPGGRESVVQASKLERSGKHLANGHRSGGDGEEVDGARWRAETAARPNQ
jgi:hypothetical protein